MLKIMIILILALTTKIEKGDQRQLLSNESSHFNSNFCLIPRFSAPFEEHPIETKTGDQVNGIHFNLITNSKGLG